MLLRRKVKRVTLVQKSRRVEPGLTPQHRRLDFFYADRQGILNAKL